ncbi:hypothetical protein [Coxiella-like endosymbiont of Rhipicephalus sanguineus]|nr:hypothetical protein [Coxiella-like endosymbiont of Rhipicephalus sanguineus]
MEENIPYKMDLDGLIGVVVALNSLFSFANSMFSEALTPEKAGL